MSKLTIAVDAMGGDFGPSITVPASMQALSLHPSLNIKLFGDDSQIKTFLPKSFDNSRLEIIHSPIQITNDDSPFEVLRQRDGSSMHLAINAVEVKQADACLSAGNTGALMAIARRKLKLISGIERPALISQIPNGKPSPTVLLDLGANTNCDAELLIQFAHMGSVFSKSVLGIDNPRVALLNIGKESIKGNDVVRQCAQKLRLAPQLNYIGYIEGNRLFDGDADVVVCDGFVGNVALKTAEGLARYMRAQVVGVQSLNPVQRLLSSWIRPKVEHNLKKLNPDQYNGASLLGLRAIVVKSHGHADQVSFLQALELCITQSQEQVAVKIAHQFSDYFGEPDHT
ncbi:phosphate acyltransferase PlsX [Alginatibacterium sediminis]|uniref:Phosphate acyltransferase n=1 Tax=Alginatibacterium sediminis TaxID=2164068 RepID=A0A420EIH5_9ALTE|nr:phosphate acyltransferase PlsX [Alginatibacterium sediminis]RKF20478.1 phosphate acyltransferase PlsX [Alginatibacterium sediminis]